MCACVFMYVRVCTCMSPLRDSEVCVRADHDLCRGNVHLHLYSFIGPPILIAFLLYQRTWVINVANLVGREGEQFG